MSTPASHLWRPSTARYVQVDGFIATPRGPQIPSPHPMVWPAKDPGDTLDYIFDIAPALVANPGDVIVTQDVAVSPNNPGDLTVVTSSVDGLRAVLWLTGGQASTTYSVTISITTAGGRALVRTVTLPVMALANVPVTNSDLTTPGGQALTDPTGTPITIF